ncbi:hypothetical protein [Caproiciproducens galactitolivorans]|uniref:Uncharacterized protein n=1 Tax=Caproiciproducens galactitolivorans TaxID=642589 RepID=A0ABT4BWM5_9FIRM|nr:hypothetical protein [Caproiciproducens galactitolivorans]MCY1715307.1 hypothetical protein [Caproiciproducens galactitolivorans]
MGACKRCGKKGLFLKLSAIGLCTDCQQRYDIEIPRENEIIKESLKIVQSSPNLNTKISRCELIIDTLKKMKNFGGDFDVIHDIGCDTGVDEMLSMYEDLYQILSKMKNNIETVILECIDQNGPSSKQSFIDYYNSDNTKYIRDETDDDLIFDISKTLPDILIEMEGHLDIKKNKTGSKYLYTFFGKE